jgi:TPP-dependent pyruvate/acetoin dehydrogenase alpha subunit
MNVVDLEHGLVGCFGIVGGSIAAATGVALGFQRRGLDHVAVAFFGEGTANQAYFAECLNFAQVLGLPAVFVCENNRYMEFTPIEAVTAGEIPARAQALGLWTKTVDGMDVQAVRGGATEAIEHARSGAGPRARDPLATERARLLDANLADEAELDALEAHVTEQIDEVVARALDAPFPDPAGAVFQEYKS